MSRTRRARPPSATTAPWRGRVAGPARDPRAAGRSPRAHAGARRAGLRGRHEPRPRPADEPARLGPRATSRRSRTSGWACDAGGLPAAAPRADRGLRRDRDAARRARRHPLPAAGRGAATTCDAVRARGRSSDRSTRSAARPGRLGHGHPARAAAQRDDAPDAQARRGRASSRRPRAAAGPAAVLRRRPQGAASTPGRSSSARPPRASPTTTSARATWSTCRRSRSTSTPVTNGAYRAFVDDGGYRAPRAGGPTRAGRGARARASSGPLYWTADGHERWFDTVEPIDPAAPVMHVSWYEADAYARSRGERLPTEAEWEKAATCVPGQRPDAALPVGRRAADARPREPRPARVPRRVAGRVPGGQLAARLRRDDRRRLGVDGAAFGGYPGFEPYPYEQYS